MENQALARPRLPSRSCSFWPRVPQTLAARVRFETDCCSPTLCSKHSETQRLLATTTRRASESALTIHHSSGNHVFSHPHSTQTHSHHPEIGIPHLEFISSLFKVQTCGGLIKPMLQSTWYFFFMQSNKAIRDVRCRAHAPFHFGCHILDVCFAPSFTCSADYSPSHSWQLCSIPPPQVHGN